jgi:hypothetical protein
MFRIFAVFVALGLASAASAKPPEQRCGWLDNPTPSNWWLNDGAGEWEMAIQGGYEAPGMDTMPDMSTRGWKVTNAGSYGYGCACMTVTTDRATMRITRIISATPQPLKLCRADRHLHRP